MLYSCIHSFVLLYALHGVVIWCFTDTWDLILEPHTLYLQLDVHAFPWSMMCVWWIIYTDMRKLKLCDLTKYNSCIRDLSGIHRANAYAGAVCHVLRAHSRQLHLKDDRWETRQLYRFVSNRNSTGPHREGTHMKSKSRRLVPCLKSSHSTWLVFKHNGVL